MTHRRGVVRRGLLPLVPERRRLADHEERGNGRRVVLRTAPPHRAARVQRRVERVRVHWFSQRWGGEGRDQSRGAAGRVRRSRAPLLRTK